MQSPRFKALLFHVVIITIIRFHKTSHSFAKEDYINSTTCYSSCGNIPNITFPFRLETDPPSCLSRSVYGVPIVLSCKNNLTILNVSFFDQYYHVQAINYNNYTIRLVESNIHKGNCSSIPKYSTNGLRFYPFETEIKYSHASKFWSASESFVSKISEVVLFLSCEKPVYNSLYIDAAPCINISAAFSTSKQNLSSLSQNTKNQYSYVAYATGFKYSDLAESCQVYRTALISSRKDKKKNRMVSYKDVHDELADGFEVSWVRSFQKDYLYDICYVDKKYNKVRCITTSCGRTRGARWCRLWKTIEQHLMMPFVYPVVGFIYRKYKYIVGLLAPRMIIGISFVIALIIYKWRRRHLSIYDGIEEFLQSHNNLMPIRYAYSDIKKMTESFKTKLGEGGFGCVYKGKLRSGRFVAIKILGKSKASGQDFINEVATIGRIHHVNVVRLVGFCAEGSKRALIYDFMPNGSLNRYIFPGEEINNSLRCKEIFEISLGIARGIEYLHRGCNMQILHFDIKPHNILLDENFIPKVSDFGLARLCSLENSIVSLTAARGTIGYIAPELFYKNIGGVSHKADVYSFGMLLMEMANRRKNINANTEHTSQIYFPTWIYDQLSKGDYDMKIEDATEEELKTIKKMIIVALWCIQLKPCDRPAMSKVIEMLEGKVECLQMPPKPCLFPQEQEKCNIAEDANEASCSSTISEEDSAEISLISNSY